jgi:protein required for attachment to host cells
VSCDAAFVAGIGLAATHGMSHANNETMWTVIADASRAVIVERTGARGRPEVVAELDHPESRAKTRDLVTGDRGRTSPRGKDIVRRAAMEPGTTAHEHAADVFSRKLAERLSSGRTQHDFDGLVLVAPPAFLGKLREALDQATVRCVRASLAKDYTLAKPLDAFAMVERQLAE